MAIAVSIGACVIWVLALSKLEGVAEKYWQVPLTILGGAFSFAFLVQKQRLDELKLFRELFAEFNVKYDGLNDDLEKLVSREVDSIDDPKDRQRVVDYFNLCAEEYWWYREGYIPDSVWGYWCRGMKYYLDKTEIKKLWDEEQKTNSYYGLTLAVVAHGVDLKG